MMNATGTLIPLTIRLEPVVSDALATAAQHEGQEVADFAADILTKHVLSEVHKIDASVGKRLTAEIEIKARAIETARRIAKPFDPSVTLKVFQAIRSDDDLRALYICAIGGGTGYERGNHIKARINRTLGAAIKTAVGANSRTIDGNRVKVQVSNELIFSYTELEPAKDPKEG
jgi:hypothetical protein